MMYNDCMTLLHAHVLYYKNVSFSWWLLSKLCHRYFSLQASSPLHFGDTTRMDIENKICDENGPRADSYDTAQKQAFDRMSEVAMVTACHMPWSHHTMHWAGLHSKATASYHDQIYKLFIAHSCRWSIISSLLYSSECMSGLLWWSLSWTSILIKTLYKSYIIVTDMKVSIGMNCVLA